MTISRFRESISIIIPIYNEEEIILDSLETVIKDLNLLFDDYELILIDDASTDGTAYILNEYLTKSPDNVVVYSHENNMGAGEGILSGIRLAKKQYFMTNCADLPFDMKDLKWIFKKILDENADGCVVVRKDRSANTIYRKLTSYANYFIIKLLIGTPFQDFQFVQIYKTDLLKKIKIESTDLFVPPEIMYRLNAYGYKIIQCITTFHKRPGGEAKYGKLKYSILAIYSILKYFIRYRILKLHMKDII